MENFSIQTEDNQLQVQSESSLSTVLKAEIDMQIATAKAYPRSLKAFLQKAQSIATISTEVSESCIYALPRGGKTIKGPSVRLAEICLSAYGNIRSGARVIKNDGRTITAQGVCHDLETNNFVSVEVSRRIFDKNGKTYSEDLQILAGMAACSIALRNAAFKVIPAALVADVYDKIEEVIKGTAETLPARRDKALKYFTDMEVKPEQICKVLEVKAIEDIDIEKLSLLSGMRTAFKNQESTLSELFPKDEKEKGKNLNDETFNTLLKDETGKAVNKNKPA